VAKRISREEFDHLRAAARGTYLTDIRAASGDSAKVSLADNKLRWAEEAANEAFNQRSGAYRFFDSIPLIGKPVAIIVDNIEKGVAEHGLILGLARGGLVGVIIAIALIAVAEAVPFAWDLGRNWVELKWGAEVKSAQREAAIKAADDKAQAFVMNFGDPIAVRQPVTCYPINQERVAAENVDGGAMSGSGGLDWLKQQDPGLFKSSRTIGHGETLTPYFLAKGKGRIATVGGPQAEFALASAGNTLVLIRLKDYDAAGLPMRRSAVNLGSSAVPSSATPMQAASTSAEAPVAPATPAASNPVTRSPNVPFVQISEGQYRHAIDAISNKDPKSAERLVTLRSLATQLDGARNLPEGTEYTPLLKTPGDPNSMATIESYDGVSSALLVTIQDGPDKKYGMIPASEYESYLKSLRGDADFAPQLAAKDMRASGFRWLC